MVELHLNIKQKYYAIFKVFKGFSLTDRKELHSVRKQKVICRRARFFIQIQAIFKRSSYRDFSTVDWHRSERESVNKWSFTVFDMICFLFFIRRQRLSCKTRGFCADVLRSGSRTKYVVWHVRLFKLYCVETGFYV